MKEDDDSDDNLSAQEQWYNDYEILLHPEIREHVKDSDVLILMLYHRYQLLVKHLIPAIRQVMLEQYPLITTEKRPLVLEKIEEIIEMTAEEVIFEMFNLEIGQSIGVNVREKYPEIDKWIDFYCRPAKPHFIDDSLRERMPWLTDEQWEKIKEEDRQETLETFNWERKRIFDFINALQSVFIEYYPQLLDLNSDEWVIYAVNVRESHTDYLERCEYIECFIEAGFPQEDIKLPYKELREKMDEYLKNKWNIKGKV
ncbi:MAG: hypothetical protein HY951_03150 [Bacteroidia bacterium]|nr:hypothetical protein [Bacteroidia bacterium]